MMLRKIVLTSLALYAFITVHAQLASNASSAGSDSNHLVSQKYLTNVSNTASKLSLKLDRKSEKTLRHLQQQEARIQRKLARKDSAKARSIFGDSEARYDQLDKQLKSASSGDYIPSLDTLRSSLKFLQQNSQLVAKAKDSEKKLQDALVKVKGLDARFGKAEAIKQFLKERRQYLKDQLSGLGFAKELKQVNKVMYYFSEQLNEYKALLKDHKKAERKAIELLSKTKLFKDFMRKHSQLASLFRLPGSPDDPASQASLAGLQTRVQVNNLIQQQVAAGGPDAREQIRQNLQQAQDQINQLKNKVTQLGRGSSDAEMSEGFKPNNQKTKSFIQRLELGANMQSQKSRNYFPVTSDIGLSLGYKLNDKSIIGIGASYKIGWGRDIRHINITHQGVGLRSFIDWKIKGSFWLSGGYEMNYRSEFRSIEELKGLSAWQQSGLIGVSKVISMKTKFSKKTKMQLMWDFLSYQQVPAATPVIFRIGYTF